MPLEIFAEQCLQNSARYPRFLQMSHNTIYAEYLPNINQISVHVSLASAFGDETSVRLDSSCNALVLQHYSDEVSITLPFQVATNTQVQIPNFEPNSKSLSLRLQAKHVGKDVAKGAEEDVPWSAETLSAQSDFVCRSCKNAVLVGCLKLWRNLPSEHWAEMMDFWHCHKPNPEVGNSLVEEDNSKTYAASNKLTARNGVGLVDTLYFVVCPQDCPAFQVSHTRKRPRILGSLNNPTMSVTGGKKAT